MDFYKNIDLTLNTEFPISKPTSWDHWFYNLCMTVASNSKCFSRKIGAILVKDKSIISTGYNGPPRGVPTCNKRWNIDKAFINKYKDKICLDTVIHDVCPRKVLGFKSGEGLDICISGHGERNALINAARMGIGTKNTIMYMNCGIPCTPCLVEIINAGVNEIVVSSLTYYDFSAHYLLENSNLKVRLFDFILPMEIKT